MLHNGLNPELRFIVWSGFILRLGFGSEASSVIGGLWSWLVAVTVVEIKIVFTMAIILVMPLQLKHK